jgi:hypothetical protein
LQLRQEIITTAKDTTFLGGRRQSRIQLSLAVITHQQPRIQLFLAVIDNQGKLFIWQAPTFPWLPTAKKIHKANKK